MDYLKTAHEDVAELVASIRMLDLLVPDELGEFAEEDEAAIQDAVEDVFHRLNACDETLDPAETAFAGLYEGLVTFGQFAEVCFHSVAVKIVRKRLHLLCCWAEIDVESTEPGVQYIAARFVAEIRTELDAGRAPQLMTEGLTEIDFDVLDAQLRKEYFEVCDLVDAGDDETEPETEHPKPKRKKFRKKSPWGQFEEQATDAYKALCDSGDWQHLKDYCQDYADDNGGSATTLEKKLNEHRNRWDPDRKYFRVEQQWRNRT